MYRDGVVAWDNLGPLGLSFVVVGLPSPCWRQWRAVAAAAAIVVS